MSLKVFMVKEVIEKIVKHLRVIMRHLRILAQTKKDYYCYQQLHSTDFTKEGSNWMVFIAF